MGTGMMQGSVQSTQRPKAGFWAIIQGMEAGFFAPADHQRGGLRRQRLRHMINQPHAVIQGVRLVTAKTARLPTGQNRAEDFQLNFSVGLPSAPYTGASASTRYFALTAFTMP